MMYLKYVVSIPFVSSWAASYLVSIKMWDVPLCTEVGGVTMVVWEHWPHEIIFALWSEVGRKWGLCRWQELVEGTEISPKFHVQHQKATGTGWLQKFICRTWISRHFSHVGLIQTQHSINCRKYPWPSLVHWLVSCCSLFILSTLAFFLGACPPSVCEIVWGSWVWA